MSWIDTAAELAREAAPEDAAEILAVLTEAIADVEADDDQVAEAVEAVVESLYEDEDERDLEAWQAELHPRASAGSAGGGQFTSGGSAGKASASKAGMAKKTGRAPRKRASFGDNGVLSFDAKSGRGAGYGKKGGDARVKKLQKALTRLGLTDSRGKKLVLDGKLGPKTTQAIKAAQRRLGVKPDGKVTPQLLAKLVAAKSLPAGKKAPTRAAVKKAMNNAVSKGKAREAIDGQRSMSDTRAILDSAVNEWAKQQSGSEYAYGWVCDFTDELVVFEWDGKSWQAPYTLTETGTTGEAELGEPTEVVAQTWYVPAAGGDPTMPAVDDPEDLIDGGADEATESVEATGGRVLEQIAGRAIEDKGLDEDGNRVFRVRIIEAGDSQNGRRYSVGVLHEAAKLYDGAKSYDHHRTVEELRSGTIAGLVGSYRNIEAAPDGLYGDLHLLPSAKHTAEALDATIAAQDEGLPPLVGISHDAMTHSKTSMIGGRRMQEVTAITKVNSADVVADPAAGGKATRVLAGGIELEESKESDVAVNAADVLAALKTATPEDLAAAGLQRSSEAAPAPQEPEGLEKASFLGGLMIKEKVTAAGLPAQVAESLAAELPDRITESDIDARVASLKAAMGLLERSTLAPTATAQVTQEALEKKVKALDAFFAGDFDNGYRSFKQAFIDVTGRSPRSAFDEDFNRTVMRESVGEYDSGDRRATESMSSSSWNLVLGDSITRRLVDEYNQPDLQNWRMITSSIVPVNDFRTQRIDRIGGYGTLPAVNQGQPYQPLTSPGNEEVTYAVTKRGGTEDVTIEMIANDDVRAISKIPQKLGLAAANTLYQFAWNFITTNAGTASNSGATIYDSTALFTGNSGHANYVNNGSGSALSQSALSAGRLLMRSQTAYGDTQQFIAPTPRYLVVVNDIEELGWQLVTSAVALPTAANTPPQSTGAANTPNLHQGLGLIVLDYIPNATTTTAWWLVADPSRIPTLEIGFYQGQQTPQLFTQSDPTVGSVFNADKVTYKIRHIYSGAVLDYRGFVKGNV